jgi:hypothetical protein
VSRAKNAEDRPKTEEAKKLNDGLRAELNHYREEQSRVSVAVEELKKERGVLLEKAVSLLVFCACARSGDDCETDFTGQYQSRGHSARKQAYSRASPFGPIARPNQAVHYREITQCD